VFSVYILYSATCRRYYCGISTDIERRLREHNDPHYTLTRTTKVLPGPWQRIWVQSDLTHGEALLRERQIKKRGIARFLENQTSLSGVPVPTQPD